MAHLLNSLYYIVFVAWLVWIVHSFSANARRNDGLLSTYAAKIYSASTSRDQRRTATTLCVYAP